MLSVAWQSERLIFDKVIRLETHLVPDPLQILRKIPPGRMGMKIDRYFAGIEQDLKGGDARILPEHVSKEFRMNSSPIKINDEIIASADDSADQWKAPPACALRLGHFDEVTRVVSRQEHDIITHVG